MGRKRTRRIGILTGGGDCPGINAVIRAVAKTAIMKYQMEVVGYQDGFWGRLGVGPIANGGVPDLL